MVIRVKAAEVIHGADACVVRCPPDVELGVGDGVFGNFAPLDDFQRRLHGVEECHRAGLAGTEGNRLGNIAEDHIGGSIDLRDLVAAHRDIRQKNASRAVCGCGGGVAAVDLLNFVGHMGNRFPGGNVFLQDLQTGFYIVGEGGLHSTGTGQQGDVLMSSGLDIRLLHGLLGNAVHTGLEIGQCLFTVHGDGGGVAARQGFHQKGRLDLGEGLRVCLGDFQAGQRAVAGGHGVLLIAIGHIHIDAVRGGVQGITLRSFHLHECPQTLGDVLYLDNAAVFGHITANDLTVAVDVEHSAIQALSSPGNHLLERDVAITGNGRRRIVAAFRLIVRHNLTGCVIGKEALAASGSGSGKNGPLARHVLHDGCLLTLRGIFLDLFLKFRILLSFLRQHPVVIANIGFIGIGVGKATGINVAGGIAACGFIALMIPDVGLQGHKQAAGDVAGIISDIGHHPLYILFDSGVHLAQSGLGSSFFPQGICVRASGAGVGIAIEEAGSSVPIGIAEIHAIELFSSSHRRAVGILLAGGGQPGRPEVGVCGCFDARSAAGSCQSGGGQQCQQGQKSQHC